MMPGPRIGLLTPGWPGHNTPNGIATAVYNLAMGLHEIGNTPVILTTRIDGDCPEGIPVVSIPEIHWHWQERLRSRLGDRSVVHRAGARTLAAAVRQAVAVHGIDTVIIEETNGWAGLVPLPVPVVVTLHGPWVLHKTVGSLGKTEDARRERRERKGFEAATGIIAPSRNVLEAVEQTVSLPSTPKIVLPNSLCSEVSGPAAAALPNHDILFVGRFDFHKGGDLVLEAFSLLSETHPQARLTFAGPDKGVQLPDGSKRHMAAALADLPERVRARIDYKGPLDRTEVAALRARHPIALVASRYEVFGYTLLEAMSAGQAIVCTDVGGPAEVLEQDTTARLVPSKDPQAMAAALGSLLEDAALRRRLGEAARARAHQEFSPSKIAARTLSFVETILRESTD